MKIRMLDLLEVRSRLQTTGCNTNLLYFCYVSILNVINMCMDITDDSFNLTLICWHLAKRIMRNTRSLTSGSEVKESCKPGVHKFWAPGLCGDCVLYGDAWYLCVLSVDLASCHLLAYTILSRILNFFKNLCTPSINLFEPSLTGVGLRYLDDYLLTNLDLYFLLILFLKLVPSSWAARFKTSSLYQK